MATLISRTSVIISGRLMKAMAMLVRQEVHTRVTSPGLASTVSTMNWAGDLSMGLSLGSGKKWLPRPSTPWE